MSYKTIISALDLAGSLDVPDWLILDCRGQFLSNKKSYTEFVQQHIPNAYYCSFSANCMSSFSNTFSDSEKSSDKQMNLIDCLIENGFTQSSQIIIYDTDSNNFTDTLWLQLRSLGCANVAVLQGGFESWLAHDLPISECQTTTSNDISVKTPQLIAGPILI